MKNYFKLLIEKVFTSIYSPILKQYLILHSRPWSCFYL